MTGIMYAEGVQENLIYCYFSHEHHHQGSWEIILIALSTTWACAAIKSEYNAGKLLSACEICSNQSRKFLNR